MRLVIPEYYPWGEPTNFVPKIYGSLPEGNRKHYFYGVIKKLGYWPEEYERSKYGIKNFHIIESTPASNDLYVSGTPLHFVINRNGFCIRFCNVIPIMFVQDIEVMWEDKDMTLFIDGLELMSNSVEYFVNEGGFDTLETFKRLYPKNFKGLSLHWEYQTVEFGDT